MPAPPAPRLRRPSPRGSAFRGRAILGATILGTILGTITIAGCRGPDLSAENDRLRARVLDLEAESAALRSNVAELESKLDAAARPGAIPPEIIANTPHVTSIELSSRSHARRGRADGAPILIAYVTPRDGRGRFVPMVGHLTVHAARLPATGEARTLGRTALAPGALRDAYRGALSAHYTVEIPLALEPGDDAASCDVRVTFEDGLTGRRHETQGAVDLRRLAE